MQSRLNRKAPLSGILLATALVVSAQQPPSKDHKLTPSEVKALVKGASTPEDHLALASYFRDLASQEEATATFHTELAEIYQAEPLSSGYQPPSPREMSRHCRYVAENAIKSAKTALKMAEYHEKMAQLMRDAPPLPRRSTPAR